MSQETTFTPELYWLLHHGRLLEWTTEPVESRIEYIKTQKPTNEIATRLRWLRPVKNPGKLPLRVLEACADYNKACADYDKACTDYLKARADYDKACTDYNKACADYDKACANHWPTIVALHKEECPGCPFDYEGTKELQFL